jgi:fructose-1,6-bisphosphatase/inositol monophosphatase family enzyme
MLDPDQLAEDLAFAHRLADRAAEVSLEYFHRGVETIVKDDDTPVSEADLETDRRMVELIKEERPEDNAPAIVLVTEAGGRYTDPEGGTRPDLSPCRFTNGRVDATLDAFLAG